MISRAARINRLVKGLNINEDAATVDVIFRLSQNTQGAGNDMLRKDMVQKYIRQWDPFCELSFNGDSVKYRGSNWLAVQTKLRELGYDVAPGVGESDDDASAPADPNDTDVITDINNIVQDDDLTDGDKIDKIGEMVLNQIESRSRRR